jgi:hypothetical protein
VHRVLLPPGAFGGRIETSLGPPIGETPASPETTGEDGTIVSSALVVIASMTTTTVATAIKAHSTILDTD